jgi:hypothetical protein
VWAGSTPQLLRAVKAFPASAKLPDSPVTALALHEASWPQFSAALGLANGQVCLLRGDAGARSCLTLFACNKPVLAPWRKAP